MLDLYKNIRKRRNELGLTQTELAQRLGYSDKSMIAKIESGKVDLPQSKIMAFAEALRTSASALMGWDGDLDQTDTPHYFKDPDAEKMIVDMYENPELRVVFDCARKVKPEDLEQVAKLIRTYIPEDNNDGC